MGYERYPRYVSVGEKRAKAEKTLKRLKKDGQIHPIVVEGNAIAKTWWGKAWNDNLEKYADYANRIGRGRSYVRHGAVLDLRIEPGKVTGLVQGSRSAPYKVTIDIHALAERTWKEITTACAGSLDSLQDLLAGKFPRALSDVFIARDKGLFPSPKEIKFSCSCPDWARMCKHVAAMLYGIGARLDEDPALFFKLRKVNVDDLISLAVKETAGALLKKAQKKTGRVIADADLGDVFGIVMEDPADFGKQQPSSPAVSKIVTQKPPKAAKTPVQEDKKKITKADPTSLVLDIVKKSKDNSSKVILGIIKKHKKGISVSLLKEKSGMADKKIRNILFQLFQQGVIARAARGIYKA